MLFYQHLRKAGGTGFCDLIRQNIGSESTPPYFCMIDRAGRLATPPWDDAEVLLTTTTDG